MTSHTAVLRLAAPLAAVLLFLPACESDNTTAPTLTPGRGLTQTAIEGDSPLHADTVVAGEDFTCALIDGRAFCWGERYAVTSPQSSVLGPSPVPVAVPGGHVFTALAAGTYHACGIEADGSAWCWGRNMYGALGAGLPEYDPEDPGSFLEIAEPASVAGGHQFRMLSLGLELTCGLDTDSHAWCWGNGGWSQLGYGGTESQNTPVAVDFAGTFGKVSVGYAKSCALSDHQMWCWGDASFGFGTGPDGDQYPTPVPAATEQSWTDLDVGPGYACALDETRKPWCWGTFAQEQLGIGLTGQGVTWWPTLVTPTAPYVDQFGAFAQIDAHTANRIFGHTCGVEQDGTAWCWGKNDDGELGNESDETCTFSSGTYACSSRPLPVNGGVSFRAIAVGRNHTCGLGIDGVVYCWGDNQYGQLGDGTFSPRSTPAPVLQPTPAVTSAWVSSRIGELAEDGALSAGRANALQALLEEAATAAEAGRPSATRMFQAVLQQLDGLVKTGALSEDDARPLLDGIHSILQLLEA